MDTFDDNYMKYTQKDDIFAEYDKKIIGFLVWNKLPAKEYGV